MILLILRKKGVDSVGAVGSPDDEEDDDDDDDDDGAFCTTCSIGHASRHPINHWSGACRIESLECRRSRRTLPSLPISRMLLRYVLRTFLVMPCTFLLARTQHSFRHSTTHHMLHRRHPSSSDLIGSSVNVPVRFETTAPEVGRTSSREPAPSSESESGAAPSSYSTAPSSPRSSGSNSSSSKSSSTATIGVCTMSGGPAGTGGGGLFGGGRDCSVLLSADDASIGIATRPRVRRRGERERVGHE